VQELPGDQRARLRGETVHATSDVLELARISGDDRAARGSCRIRVRCGQEHAVLHEQVQVGVTARAFEFDLAVRQTLEQVPEGVVAFEAADPVPARIAATMASGSTYPAGRLDRAISASAGTAAQLAE
jgi:hypothetical protein